MADIILKGTYPNPKHYHWAFYIVRYANGEGKELSVEDETELTEILCKLESWDATSQKNKTSSEVRPQLAKLRDMCKSVAIAKTDMGTLRQAMDDYANSRDVKGRVGQKLPISEALDRLADKYGSAKFMEGLKEWLSDKE